MLSPLSLADLQCAVLRPRFWASPASTKAELTRSESPGQIDLWDFLVAVQQTMWGRPCQRAHEELQRNVPTVLQASEL